MPPPPKPASPPLSFADRLALAGVWLRREVGDPLVGAWQTFIAGVRREPVQAAMWAAAIGAIVYFYGFYQVFVNGSQSSAVWAWKGWNEENDQQHCVAIMPLVFFILWYHRQELARAVKEPSNRGLAFVLGGVITFVLAVRCLQPRFAIVSLPLIVYGAAEYLGGRAMARVFIFPCLLMLFMIPIGGVVQSTVTLQVFASNTVGAICHLLGIHVQIVGANIIVDGHSFEVAGGCSGIRSLMAMTMLAALYVHFTQNESWKQFVIFFGSIVFALVGNIARLFTVVLVAKWYDPGVAGGLYHDYSGFVFFPIAVVAMVGFGNLLNRDWSSVKAHVAKTLTAPESTPVKAEGKAGEEKPVSPISYDY